jgi:hypothetical protein
MPPEEFDPTSESLISSLRSLRPVAPSVDCNQLWYEAGQASVRASFQRRRTWQVAMPSTICVAIGLAVGLWVRNESVTSDHETPSHIPSIAHESNGEHELRSENLSQTAQWRLRLELFDRGMLTEPTAPPSAKTSTVDPDTIWHWRDALLRG